MLPSVSSQVDDGEDSNPDDVQRVPEQREAKQSPTHHGLKAEGGNLQQHDDQPGESKANVETMGTDEGKKSRQEGAVRRAGTG